MRDIFGRELYMGDLVIATDSSVAIRKESLGIVVGDNQIFRIIRGKGSVKEYSNVLFIPIETQSQKEIKDSLLEMYNEYQKEILLRNRIIMDITPGDVIYTKSYYSRTFVYLGRYLCNIKYKNPLPYTNTAPYYYRDVDFENQVLDLFIDEKVYMAVRKHSYKYLLSYIYTQSNISDGATFNLNKEFSKKKGSVVITGNRDVEIRSKKMIGSFKYIGGDTYEGNV